MAIAGLYGSDGTTNVPRVIVAELIGTFFLVFFGTAVAMNAAIGLPIAGPLSGSFGIAISFGLVLLVLVYALGNLSGCHLNPAISVALAVTRNFKPSYLLAYVPAQLVGAVAASELTYNIYGKQGLEKAGLGATLPAAGVADLKVIVVEAIGTGLLMFAVIATTSKRFQASASGVIVGSALTVAILFAGPLTGGGMNPARTFGPMFVSGNYTSWWAYFLGQIIGACVVTFVFGYIANAKVPDSDAPSMTEGEPDSSSTASPQGPTRKKRMSRVTSTTS